MDLLFAFSSEKQIPRARERALAMTILERWTALSIGSVLI